MKLNKNSLNRRVQVFGNYEKNYMGNRMFIILVPNTSPDKDDHSTKREVVHIYSGQNELCA